MISFKEGQDKIFVGKNKITKSSYDGFLDFHIVYTADEKTGYSNNKFVRIIAFENMYDFETIKNITTNNCDDELEIMYLENGGYVYDKKTF